MECKNCKTELTFMEEAKCLRCLKCNPVNDKPAEVADKKTNYVDVPWTEGRIWEVVKPKVVELFREMLEDWHSPVTERVLPRQPDNPPMDWRAQARELGIEVYDRANKRPRKKIDVLAEIAEKTAEAGNGV